MWNYAELSKLAKSNGGPEKLVDLLVNSGKKSMFPYIGLAAILGSILTVGSQKAIKYFNTKKLQSDSEITAAKQEIIQGIRDYDSQHLDSNCEASDVDETNEKNREDKNE